MNHASPIIRLRRLSDDELLALITRLTKLHAAKGGHDELVSAEEMAEFLKVTLARAGSDEMVTPREIIRDYLTLLNILRDNPEAKFSALVAPQKKAEDAPVTSDRPADKSRENTFDLADLEF